MQVRKRARASATAPEQHGGRPHSSTAPSGPASSGLQSLFIVLVTIRILNALCTRTFFQPDEHYQTTEIAHRIVFGYGFKSWEWHGASHALPRPAQSYAGAAVENLLQGPIRCILHPLLFVPGYALLRLARLDHTPLLVALPRCQQALVAALGDFYTFRLAHRVGGPRLAWFAMLVSLSNVYTLYTATRTFSNSTEAALTAAALFYWPFVPFFSRRFDAWTFSSPQDQARLLELQGPDCEWRQMLAGAPFKQEQDASVPVDPSTRSDRDLDVKQVCRIIYDRSLRKSLCLAAFACLLRPTNGVLWIVLVSELFVRQLHCLRSRPPSEATPAKGARQTRAAVADNQDGSLVPVLEIVGEAASLASTVAKIASITLVMALTVDTAYDYLSHQRSRPGPPLPALSLVSFVHKNVFANLSLFYGANPWHWFLSQGLPVLCMIWLPATLFGLVDALQSKAASLGSGIQRSLARLVLLTVAGYSLLGHKEFRFLQPLLPALAILAASGLVTSYATRSDAQDHPIDTAGAPKQIWRALNMLPLWLRAVVLTLQPVLSIYLNTIHGVGQEQAPYELGRTYRSQRAELARNASAIPLAEPAEFAPGLGRIHNLGFLMPCHSTPWATHLHDRELVERSWFVQCPPPPASSGMTPAQRRTKYWDQSDFFYDDPIKYLVERLPYNVDTAFPPPPPAAPERDRTHPWDLGWRHSWPSHLVVFESLLSEGTRKAGHTRTLQNVLSLKGYREVARYWNTPKHEDSRRDGDLVVLEYKGPKTRPAQPI